MQSTGYREVISLSAAWGLVMALNIGNPIHFQGMIHPFGVPAPFLCTIQHVHALPCGEPVTIVRRNELSSRFMS